MEVEEDTRLGAYDRRTRALTSWRPVVPCRRDSTLLPSLSLSRPPSTFSLIPFSLRLRIDSIDSADRTLRVRLCVGRHLSSDPDLAFFLSIVRLLGQNQTDHPPARCSNRPLLQLPTARAFSRYSFRIARQGIACQIVASLPAECVKFLRYALLRFQEEEGSPL